jgi:hypothetical protein
MSGHESVSVVSSHPLLGSSFTLVQATAAAALCATGERSEEQNAGALIDRPVVRVWRPYRRGDLRGREARGTCYQRAAGNDEGPASRGLR